MFGNFFICRLRNWLGKYMEIDKFLCIISYPSKIFWLPTKTSCFSRKCKNICISIIALMFGNFFICRLKKLASWLQKLLCLHEHDYQLYCSLHWPFWNSNKQKTIKFNCCHVNVVSGSKSNFSLKQNKLHVLYVCANRCCASNNFQADSEHFIQRFFIKLCWWKKKMQQNALILHHEVAEQKNLCSKTCLHHKASTKLVREIKSRIYLQYNFCGFTVLNAANCNLGSEAHVGLIISLL